MTQHRSRIACAALALLSVGGIAHAVTPADADVPSSHQRVSRSDLLQPQDVVNAIPAAAGVSSQVHADGRTALSSCTGNTGVRDVLGQRSHILRGTIRGREAQTGAPFEIGSVVADRATVASARRVLADVTQRLHVCHDRGAGAWHYGPAHRTDDRGETTTWMTVVDGDGTRRGGVVVARDGRNVAVTQTDVGSARQVAALAAAVQRRLG